MLYKEAVAVQIDLGRFTTAAKLQKEIAELYEAESDLTAAMEAFQTAADYYNGEESTSAANQCLLKVAGFAASTLDYKRAIEIYEQVCHVAGSLKYLRRYRIIPTPDIVGILNAFLAPHAHTFSPMLLLLLLLNRTSALCRWRTPRSRARCSSGASKTTCYARESAIWRAARLATPSPRSSATRCATAPAHATPCASMLMTWPSRMRRSRAISHTSRAISHTPRAISHTPRAISHTSRAISHQALDASFGGTREGQFLEKITKAYENLDADAFTEVRAVSHYQPNEAPS